MKLNPLGSSGLQVSEFCLGSMTWGEQNTKDEAFEQIDVAVDAGINFVDTAELYPVPPSQSTYGKTETIVGDWLKTNKAMREQLIIASKVAGMGLTWIRDGERISSAGVSRAIEGSLARLQTEYIDLYQVHWPNRLTPHFAKHWIGKVDPRRCKTAREEDEMQKILRSLKRAVDAGKIRHVGLSNETPWGLERYLCIAKAENLPCVVSVQNEFNLLHLKDWPYLMETCIHHNVAYLAWSPLAGGVLSGKYRKGAIPHNSRWSLTQRHGLFRNTPSAHAAVEAYLEVANNAGLSLAQLTLAWLKEVPGITSVIVGATSISQLRENLCANDIVLSTDVQQAMIEVVKRHPIPF